MKAKQYLNQFKKINDDIDSQIEQIERLRARAERCTAELTDEPMGGGTSDKTAVIDRRIDLEAKLSDKVIHLYDMIDEADGLISGLDKAEHRAVLRHYYINDKTWEETAVAMHYSYKWIHHLHGRALLELDKLMNRG